MSIPIPREQCRHRELIFGSGDYYIFCAECSASWMTRGASKQEYGAAADGAEIGGAPEQANKGVGNTLSGQRRYTITDGQSEGK